jgi:hypothetical protein
VRSSIFFLFFFFSFLNFSWSCWTAERKSRIDTHTHTHPFLSLGCRGYRLYRRRAPSCSFPRPCSFSILYLLWIFGLGAKLPNSKNTTNRTRGEIIPTKLNALKLNAVRCNAI